MSAAARSGEPGPESTAQRPCLIVNPLSFRAARGLAEQAAEVARGLGVEVVVIHGPAALAAAVDAVLARRQQHLMLLAGDGTVRAVIEQLAGLPPHAWLPDLLVLPGGRTNLIANDLTPGQSALPLLEIAVQRIAAARWSESVTDRVTLCIEQAGAPARHGFWMGAAVVDGVIRRTHQYRASGRGALKTGPLSTPIALLRLAALALVGRPAVTAPEMRISDPGRGVLLNGRVSLLLATTLHHRQGLFDPYATRATGPMRVTAVARHARGFWRSLPRLLTGRFSDRMDVAGGYVSGTFPSLEITGLGSYSFDGESFDTDPARPVHIRNGARLRFFAS